MLRLKSYINEGVKLKLIRGKDMDVLKMWNKGDKKWVELRGKSGFERKYDPKDPLHKAISALGKSANISDFVNGDEVSINPNHPDGKKALKTINALMNETGGFQPAMMLHEPTKKKILAKQKKNREKK
jgi:hypothetical protein